MGIHSRFCALILHPLLRGGLQLTDPPMHSLVIIATRGRPLIAAETVSHLRALRPDIPLIVVGTEPDDIVGITPDIHTHCCLGPAGLTRQRNCGVRHALAYKPDLLYFFDDDMELHHGYFSAVECLMQRQSDVIAGSGTTLADGGITRAEARELINRAAPPDAETFRTHGRHWTLYGCNMFIRAAAFKHVAFDERLPLYSWGEDYAISIALRRQGLVGRLNRALCVHLKIPGGRLQPAKLAFSMCTNVFYFFRTGCSHRSGWMEIARLGYVMFYWIPVAEVRRRQLNSKQMVAWWGGWLRALGEIITGRSKPENLLLRWAKESNPSAAQESKPSTA